MRETVAQSRRDTALRVRNDTVAAIGGLVAILFVASAAFPWATNAAGADFFTTPYIPILGGVLLALFAAYWFAFVEQMRLLSGLILAAAVACLGLAALQFQVSRNAAEAAGEAGAIGAGAVLALIAAFAAVIIGAVLVAQSAGVMRPVPGVVESRP